MTMWIITYYVEGDPSVRIWPVAYTTQDEADRQFRQQSGLVEDCRIISHFIDCVELEVPALEPALYYGRPGAN